MNESQLQKGKEIFCHATMLHYLISVILLCCFAPTWLAIASIVVFVAIAILFVVLLHFDNDDEGSEV